MSNRIQCTCTNQWEINPRCPVHGYIKPSNEHSEPRVCLEELFLKQLPPRKPKNYELEELLYAIIDRAKIGQDVAITEDEETNFHWIMEMAQMALEKNKQ